MRFLMFYILSATVVIIAAIPANLENVSQSLYDVDVQGHENAGDREARQFGFGGYNSYGGYQGGYGGNQHSRRGNYGGHRGGFNNIGDYRAGYGGFGGYRGDFNG